MEKSPTGTCKVAKGSELVIDKIDHLRAKAENLRATACGISSFILGPRPGSPSPENPGKPAGFIGEVSARLDDVGQVLNEVQGFLDGVREQL